MKNFTLVCWTEKITGGDKLYLNCRNILNLKWMDLDISSNNIYVGMFEWTNSHIQ